MRSRGKTWCDLLCRPQSAPAARPRFCDSLLLLLLLQKITKSCNNSAGKRQFRKLFEKPFKIKLNNGREKGSEKGSETQLRELRKKTARAALIFLFQLLLLLLLSMYFNIKFCCTHNFLPYLRFVICVCGFYCGALRFASVGGSGNCWCDREMCVHVYVFSLLHVACGMSIWNVAAAATATLWFLLQEVTWQSSSACLERPPLCLFSLHTLSRGVPSWESLIELKDVNARRVLRVVVCMCVRVCV